MRYVLYYSPSLDIYHHLATEQSLLAAALPDTRILYLWQSDRAVVIGKNQNIWMACNCNVLKKHDLVPARRFSGGGAVYHDCGNLNYSFICPKNAYIPRNHFTILIDALKPWGISAYLNDTHALCVENKKISGNAFCIKKDHVLHHGTLLIDTDTTLFSSLFEPSFDHITGNGVQSTIAEVINCRNINPTLSLSSLIDSVCESFYRFYGNHTFRSPVLPDIDQSSFSSYYKKLTTFSWIFGRSPPCRLSFHPDFSWGKIPVHLDIVDGNIKNILFEHTHAAVLEQEIKKNIYSKPFIKETILKALRRCKKQSSQLLEFIRWIELLSF